MQQSRSNPMRNSVIITIIFITIIVIDIVIEENTIILTMKVMQKLQYENISCHGALKFYKNNSSNNTILSIYK